MKFTKIPSDTFKKLQINAGILTTDFTPSSGAIGENGQIGATTGGVNFTATPTYSDFGEDIDNCPKNMMELKKLDTWEVKLTGTYVTVQEMFDTLARLHVTDGLTYTEIAARKNTFADAEAYNRTYIDCTIYAANIFIQK